MKAETGNMRDFMHSAIDQALKTEVRVMIRAGGQSMRPWIMDGDRLTVASCDATRLQKGEIGLYKAQDGLITIHRVVDKDADRCAFRGDATSGKVEWVPHSAVSGRVESATRNNRTIYRNTAFHRWTGRLWHLSGPLRRFIAKARRRGLPQAQ